MDVAERVVTLDANIGQVGAEGAARPASAWRPAKTLEEAVANPVKG